MAKPPTISTLSENNRESAYPKLAAEESSTPAEQKLFSYLILFLHCQNARKQMHGFLHQPRLLRLRSQADPAGCRVIRGSLLLPFRFCLSSRQRYIKERIGFLQSIRLHVYNRSMTNRWLWCHVDLHMGYFSWSALRLRSSYQDVGTNSGDQPADQRHKRQTTRDSSWIKDVPIEFLGVLPTRVPYLILYVITPFASPSNDCHLMLYLDRMCAMIVALVECDWLTGRCLICDKVPIPWEQELTEYNIEKPHWSKVCRVIRLQLNSWWSILLLLLVDKLWV